MKMQKTKIIMFASGRVFAQVYVNGQNWGGGLYNSLAELIEDLRTMIPQPERTP